MTDNRQRIARWLSGHRVTERAGHLVLSQAAKKGGGTEILTVQGERLADPSSVIEEIMQAVEDDATGRGGVCRYLLTAWQGEPEGDAVKLAELPLRVDLETELALYTGGEDLSARDLLGQLMRHNEVQSRTLVLAMGGVLGAQARIIEAQTRRLERLEGKHLEMICATEELLSERHTRELETQKAARLGKQQAKLLSKVNLLLPVVANKLAGKPVLPEATSPRLLAFKALVRKLTPAQIESISQSLEPDELHAFLTICEEELEGKKPSGPNGANGGAH